MHMKACMYIYKYKVACNNLNSKSNLHVRVKILTISVVASKQFSTQWSLLISSKPSSQAKSLKLWNLCWHQSFKTIYGENSVPAVCVRTRDNDNDG